MSAPIIPAGEWPEHAEAIVWDSDGQSLELRLFRLFGSDWGLVFTQPRIEMPTGWDWRVPVMRPAAVPVIDRDRLLAALERAAAAETELARLRDQQAIDLEQFRSALVALSDYAYERHGHTDHPHCVEADRLLSLIDGQSVSEMPQKGRCPNNAAPGGCQLPNRFCTFPSCDKADDLQPTKGEGE